MMARDTRNITGVFPKKGNSLSFQLKRMEGFRGPAEQQGGC
jgi:hypothetical protein